MTGIELLEKKVRDQLGFLTFRLMTKDAECELLQEENEKLKEALKQFEDMKKEEKIDGSNTPNAKQPA